MSAATASPLAEAIEEQGAELNPTIPQDDFMFTEAQFPAFVGGYGSGKTEALLGRAIMGKIRYPRLDRAFYEPTYDLVRMIAWPRFEELLTRLNVPYKLLKHPKNELKIEGNGSIHFRSMDKPGSIIGYEVADSDVDELDTLKEENAAEVWRKILARNRQRKPLVRADYGDGVARILPALNTVGVATTPEGFSFVYKTWEANPPGPGYELIRAPTRSNPHITQAYIDSLLQIYPPNLVAAYLEGKFVNLRTGTVYTGFDRRACNTLIVQEPGEPLFVGMDFNVGHMSAVIHVKRDGAPIAVGEITQGFDTPHMIDLIFERYPGHPIHVYPDASGKSRKSVNASETDISLLRDARFHVYAKSKNPPVRDRVLAMNTAFTRRGYLVNVDRCPAYAATLEQQTYNPQGEPDKTHGDDHLNDGAGYFIVYDYPVERPVIQTSIGMVH